MAILAGGTSGASTIVVSPGANLSSVASGLSPGDVLHLLPGTYQTPGFVLPPATTLRGSGFDTVIAGFANETETIIRAESDTTIEHIRFTNARHAITIYAGTASVLVQSILATDFIFDPLTVDGSDVTIRNNILVDNFRYGIDIRYGAQPLIENNTLVGNGTGINLDHASGTIRNNIIVGSVGGSGVANDGAAIRYTHPYGPPASDPLIEYNLTFANVSGDFVGYLRPPPPIGEGNLHADPLFVGGVDPATAYLLSQIAGGQAVTSPAVDAGSPASSVFGSTALNGIFDTGRIDVGYHFVEPAPVPEPSTGLLVAFGLLGLGVAGRRPGL